MTRAVGYWLRTTRRQRTRTAALVALLLVIGGGCSMAAAAGARRTATVLDRFEAELPSFDGTVLAEDQASLEAALGLPGIAAHQRFFMAGLLVADRPCGFGNADFFPFTVNEGDPHRLDRVALVAGRLPGPGRTDEVALPAIVAERLGLDLGDVLHLGVPAGQPDCDGILVPDMAEVFDFRVVGITRRASEIGAIMQDFAVTPLPAAFADRHPGLPDVSGPAALVELEANADRDRLRAAAEAVGAELDVTFLVGPRIGSTVDTAAAGLWVVAAALAVATVVGAGLALARLAEASTEDLRALAALGVDRRGRSLAAGSAGVVAVGAGAIGAALTSVALSPLHPFGVARQAELHPGVDVDITVLASGAAGILACGLVLALAGGVLAAARAASHERRPRARRVVDLLAAGSVPPWGVIGATYATDRGGAEAVPGRTAVLGAAAGVAGVAAALLFAGSLDATLTDPARYGWGSFDAAVAVGSLESERSAEAEDRVVHRLLEERGASVATLHERRELRLGDELVSGHFVAHRRGTATFTLAAGRAPEGAREIALGAETADDLGLVVGDRVAAAAPDGTRPAVMLEVVGLVAFPPSEDALPLAEGFLADVAVASTVGDDLVCLEFEECGTSQWIDLGPGVDVAAVRSRLIDEGFEVNRPAPGAGVQRLREVADLPSLLAVVLAVLGAGGMVHALAATPSRRRRELATLAAIGFRRRDRIGVLLAEGVVIGALGGALGALAGWVLGRAAWQQVAGAVGVPGSTDAVARSLAVAAVGAVVLGVGLAVAPARRLARTSPAVALREEAG